MRRLSNPAVTVTLILLVGIGIGVFAPTLLPTIPKVQAANVTIVLSGCVFACPNVGWNGTTSSPRDLGCDRCNCTLPSPIHFAESNSAGTRARLRKNASKRTANADTLQIADVNFSKRSSTDSRGYDETKTIVSVLVS